MGGLPAYPGAVLMAWSACSRAALADAFASGAQPGSFGLGGSCECLLSVSFPCGFTLRPHKFTLNFRFKWMQKSQHKRQSKPLLTVGEVSLTVYQMVLYKKYKLISPFQWMFPHSVLWKQSTATPSLASIWNFLNTTIVGFFLCWLLSMYMLPLSFLSWLFKCTQIICTTAVGLFFNFIRL